MKSIKPSKQMTGDTLSLRRHIERFTTLKDEDWLLLEPYLYEKFIAKNEFMIREGEKARELGFILSGDMRHFYTRDGEEKTTYFYFESMLVGPYLACITGQPSQLSIQALNDTKLIVFPYTVLRSLFDQSKAWERFGRLLAEYMSIGLEERMVGLLTLSPEERYMQLLSSNKKRILERIPQLHIANYLGITAVSLSRIRNRVQKK